jgi:hypothetical protein
MFRFLPRGLLSELAEQSRARGGQSRSVADIQLIGGKSVIQQLLLATLCFLPTLYFT